MLEERGRLAAHWQQEKSAIQSIRHMLVQFPLLVAVGWVGARVAMLWPQTGSLPAAIEALVPLAKASRPAPPDSGRLPAVRVAGQVRDRLAAVHLRKSLTTAAPPECRRC